ncbi:cysteine desulfurase family protein [Lacticaseibacillus sp. GG6-2]
MIYFDHAATTPMSPAALDAYTEVAKHFYANSESLHRAGNEAGQLVQDARLQVARQLGVPADGLIFTSGGTEANQLGIEALATGSDRREILVSPLEHSSVYEILDRLARMQDFTIRELPVDESGHVTPDALTAELSDQTGLVVVQAVNAITGIVQDVTALNAVAQAQKVPLFVDAVQGVAKVPLVLTDLAGFSVSAHKFNGPKSCGFLYLSPAVPSQPRFHNVFQQNGYLPGTMDVPGIVSSETALEAAMAGRDASLKQLSALRKQLLAGLADTIMPVVPDGGFPGIIGLLLPHTQGQEAATWLGQHDICLSTVSACSIKDPRPDKTLQALGLTEDQAARYLRLSLGPTNTADEVARVLQVLNERYA